MFNSLPICRVCLKTSLEYIDFDTPYEVDANSTTKTDNGLTYLDCFQACTRIEIEFDENFPQSLCSTCGFELKIAFEFLQKAESADKTLRQLQSTSTKVEKIEGDDEMKFYLQSESSDRTSEEKTKTLKDGGAENASDEEKTYVCTVCGEQFFSQTVLNLHVNRLHSSKSPSENQHFIDAVEKVECQICDTIVPVEHLESHMQMHEEESNFEVNNEEKTVFEEEVVIDNEPDEVEFEMLDMNISIEDDEGVTIQNESEVQETVTEPESYELTDSNYEVMSSQAKNDTTRSDDGANDTDPDTDGEQNAVTDNANADADDHFDSEFNVIAKLITQEEKLKQRSGTSKFKQCEVCSKQVRLSSFTTHMNAHNGVKQFPCDFCLQAYFSKRSLQKHVKANHMDCLTSTCSICNATVEYNDMKIHNEEKHSHTVKCEECDHQCPESKLKDHMKRKHSNSKDFLCNVCSKTFTRMGSLTAHMKTHQQKRQSAKPLICEICGKISPSASVASVHKQIHNESRLTYPCQDCDKTYFTKTALNQHRRWHTGRSFQCVQCPKMFVQKAEYRIHLRFHNRDFPHQCEICGKKFNAKGHLTAHLNMHLGMKIKCNVCGKLFATRGAYSDHSFKHSEMPYKCLHCPKGYPTKSKLRYHLKATHSVELTINEISEMFVQKPTVKIRQKLEWIKVGSDELSPNVNQ